MRFLFTLALLSSLSPILAGGWISTSGAKAMSLGNASISLINVFSAQNNAAASAFLPHSAIGFSYENQFLLKELSQSNLSAVYKNEKIGAFSATLSHFGYSLYSETHLGSSYARKFGNKLGLGMKVSYHNLSIQENGNKSLLSIQLGILYVPIEKMNIGVSIINPIRFKIDKTTKESLPSIFQLGISYLPSNKILVISELSKDLTMPFSLKIGIEYQLHPILSIRIGGSINPMLISGGFGLKLNKTQIDLASSWDINLGYSPKISAQYDFRKKQKKENIQ